MRIVAGVTELREIVSGWRASGDRIAFVPTMGNLHPGHYSLIERARAPRQRVVASIFVNPTQFGPSEDFSRYPRTPEQDQAGLRAVGCDLLFAPRVDDMYPFGTLMSVAVHVPGITDELDGAARPGHFDGVATVVLRLLNMVQADLAVFGRKDYQQLLVVRHLVRDLALPVVIDAAPTQRESDGLAMSSRNQYLDASQRALAPLIYRTLQQMRAGMLAGRSAAQLESEAEAGLVKAGFRVDYAQFRHQSDLSRPSDRERNGLIALIAARLGSTRLIDNLDV